MISALSNNIVLLFGLAITTNIAALSFLPKTAGFTQTGVAFGVLAVFAINLWALARILHNGIDLGLLVPIMTAMIPVVIMLVGVFIYGEQYSLARIGLLVTACCLVAFASYIP